MLLSGSSAKIFKDHKTVVLYPKAETDPLWRVPFESTRLTKISNPPHEITSKISSTHSVSPKFEHPGETTETEKFSENFLKIEIETLDDNILESGAANAVIRHQMNGERLQRHHAAFGFPFASSFIKALNRDVHVP